MRLNQQIQATGSGFQKHEDIPKKCHVGVNMSPGCRDDPQPLQVKDIQSLLRLNLSYIEPTSSGPAEILPHLFLGSRDDAVNVKVLKSLGITHVSLAPTVYGFGFWDVLGIFETHHEDARWWDDVNMFSTPETTSGLATWLDTGPPTSRAMGSWQPA